MNWYEELGRAIAQEFGIKEGALIEHQCGTVWVSTGVGNPIAITSMQTEGDD